MATRMPPRVLLPRSWAPIRGCLAHASFPILFRSRRQRRCGEGCSFLFSGRTMRLNFYLFKSTIVGALGGLLFGFDTAVIAGTTHQLTEVFHLTPGELGFTVSIALW